MYHLSLYKLAIGPSCIIVKFTHFEWVYLSELFFHQKMFENLHMHVFYFHLKLMNTTKIKQNPLYLWKHEYAVDGKCNFLIDIQMIKILYEYIYMCICVKLKNL